MFRRVLVAAVLLVALLAATGRASSTTISPCTAVSFATWSPDGTQIVYAGTRWPRPVRTKGGIDILQALCTMNADGTNAQPLRYTVCSEDCPGFGPLIVWLRSGILYMPYADILRIVPGSEPQKIARADAVAYVTNQAGTRIATQKYYPGCQGCGAPITILDAQSGTVVGTAGGRKFDNVAPSLSPDGSQVAFVRGAYNDPGKTFGIWTATAHGKHLRQLVKVGQQPLWSPQGGTIAYVVAAGDSVALHLVPAAGGKSRTLVRNVSSVFGWSPDGKSIAFETSKGKLAVVYVATGKVRRLQLQLRFSAAPVWAPDSSELLATTKSAAHACPSVYRVPVDGSKPTPISTCS